MSSLGTVSLHSEDELSGDEAEGGLNLASIDKKIIARYRKAMLASCKDPDLEEDSDAFEPAKGERPLTTSHHDALCKVYRDSQKTEIDNAEYT